MGLDIAFDRTKAIAAGLKVVVERMGTDADIAKAKAELAEGNSHIDYVNWLMSESEFIEVPGRDGVLVQNDGVDSIVVRANKWGHTYGPLTEWLKANDIEWSEF